MLEDIRRSMSHRREAKEKERLKKLEKERRLSYLRMKRLEERKGVEEGLREQVGTELSAHKAAKSAYQERKQMEHELRVSRGPSIARRVGRATKTVLYDFPVKSVRIGAKLGKGTNLQKALLGDANFVLGTSKLTAPPTPQKSSTSLDEFMFGKPTTDKGISDIGKDILG